jgi:hypothetical protein
LSWGPGLPAGSMMNGTVRLSRHQLSAALLAALLCHPTLTASCDRHNCLVDRHRMCRCIIARQHSGLRCLGPACGRRSDGLCCPRLQHHLDSPQVLPLLLRSCQRVPL